MASSASYKYSALLATGMALPATGTTLPVKDSALPVKQLRTALSGYKISFIIYIDSLPAIGMGLPTGLYHLYGQL
jgi:hypothetical protein